MFLGLIEEALRQRFFGFHFLFGNSELDLSDWHIRSSSSDFRLGHDLRSRRQWCRIQPSADEQSKNWE